MKIKTCLLRCILIVCLFAHIVLPKEKVFADDLNLNALSAVLIDAENGRILYGKEPHEKRAMASTTKIMTCMIALEFGNLEDVVTFSDYAAAMPKVKMGGKSGEQYKLKDLLYSLMLESHNDVAVAIAEHIGGNTEGFTRLMNEKAKQIGAVDTNFVTPNGLDDPNHYSTAYDMALIGAYAIKNEQFIEITNTQSYTFQDITAKRTICVNNKDAFLTMKEDAIGIKTGFTGNAGYCFVGAIKNGEHHLVSAVLGSGWPPNKSLKWKDTLSLMNYGTKNYEYKKVFDGVEKFEEIKVVDGVKETVSTEIKGELSMLLADYENVTCEAEMKSYVYAPVRKGQSVGTLNVSVDGVKTAAFDICTTDIVKKIDFSFCFDRMLKGFLLFE